MRGFNHCRVLLFLVVSFVSLPSWSGDYYWFVEGATSYTGSSPSSTCSSFIAATGGGAICSVTRVTDERYHCSLIRPGGDCATTDFSLDVLRDGTQCPTGTEFNPVTGSCDAPVNECSDKTGTSSEFSKSGPLNDGYYSFSGGYGAPAQDGCFGGCAVSTVDQKCTGNLKNHTYMCRGTMYYSGAQCTTSPASEVDETTDTSRPDPESYKDQTPCNYTTDGTGAQVCTSSSIEGKEGQYCGTVNGVKTCVDSKPTQNGIEITTKVETTANADGSTTTTKTDTANSTSCTGHDECISSSTTTTTTTTKDGNGNTTSVTGSCTGAQCPDENTNPDGDGDGFGDCIGDDCGDDSETTEPTVEAEVTAFEYPELLPADAPEFADTAQAFIEKVQTIPFIQAARSIAIPGGGGDCQVGALSLWGGSISMNSFCEVLPTVLDPLSYLFLAMWSLAALRVLLSA